MKKKIIIILGIVLSIVLCFSSCDAGVFDDEENSSGSSSGSTPGVADDYRLSKITQTSDGNIYISSYDYISGLKINKITTSQNGNASATSVYSYNSDDTISEFTTTYTDSSIPALKYKYSNYDAHDNFQRLDLYYGNTLSSYTTYSYVYDSSGELTASTQKYYSASGTLSMTTVSTYKNEKIMKSESSASNYYSVYTYTYDSHGCITELSTTTTSTTSTTATYINEYSSVGNLIKQIQLGGTVIEYEYEKY